jgi:hypothetical protein
MSGEIILFKSGCCEGSFGVEESSELGYECFSLEEGVSMCISIPQASERTLSNISCSFDSFCLSSSEGFAGMFATVANCEYVWNSDSVYLWSDNLGSLRQLLGLLTWVSNDLAWFRS